MKILSTMKVVKEIHPESIVLLKVGTFYNAYFKDAILLNYLFGYKLKKQDNVHNCGFPDNAIQRVKYVLEQNRINYLLVDRAHNYEETEKQEEKENNYNECYERAYKHVYLKERIENVHTFLMENIQDERIMEYLTKVECVIHEKG